MGNEIVDFSGRLSSVKEIKSSVELGVVAARRAERSTYYTTLLQSSSTPFCPSPALIHVWYGMDDFDEQRRKSVLDVVAADVVVMMKKHLLMKVHRDYLL
jgi:hypothetical protein